MNGRNEAIQVLDQHPHARVLTIDFFDTMVTRAVAQPTHVFAVMEQRLIDEVGPQWRGFAQKRVQVEHDMRVKVAQSGSLRDITHAEIIRAIADEFNLADADAEILRRMECNCEIDEARVVEFGRHVVDEARSRNMRVVIVSDNYMSSAHIARMARAAGYEWVTAEDVIVSCEHSGMKQNGALWKHVPSMVGVSAQHIVHVGDSKIPDCDQPSRYGIRCHVDNRMSKWHRHPLNTCPDVLPFSRLEASLRDDGVQTNDVWFTLGSTLMALMVAGQVKDVISQVETRSIAGIHFAARDGWMAHHVWDAIRMTMPSDIPSSSYVSFSRSVIGRANIRVVTPEVAIRFIDDHEVLSVRRLNARFGCQMQSLVDIDKEIDAETARAIIIANSDNIVAASQALRARVVGHLREKGVLTPGHHIVVDLGWRGTTMADLADIVFEATDGLATIEGRFLGLYWDATMNRTRVPLHGYAMDDLGPLDDNIRLLGALRLFELLITAPHGSVIDFFDENGGYQPIFADSEFQSSAEAVHVPAAMKYAIEVAQRILMGQHSSGVSFTDITPQSVWAAMMQVGHTPRLEELHELRAQSHVSSVDHADSGTELLAPAPRWSSTLPLHRFSSVYDNAMKRHWLQGSIRSWQENSATKDFADAVIRLWPFMGPVWCDAD